MSETRLVLASKNAKKLKELEAIFTFPGVRIVSLTEFEPIDEVVEDGVTFEENAVKKALGYAAQTGCLTIADDSGLCVDYLDGRPGVFSARYAGEGKNDSENCMKVLQELESCPDHLRSASFLSVVAIAEPEKVVAVVTGTVHGFITHEMKGDRGFGYDPIFHYPAFNATFGEVPPERKHRVSHRAMALEKAEEALTEYFS